MIRITLSEWFLWGLGFFLAGLVAGLWARRPVKTWDANATIESHDLVRALARKCRRR